MTQADHEDVTQRAVDVARVIDEVPRQLGWRIAPTAVSGPRLARRLARGLHLTVLDVHDDLGRWRIEVPDEPSMLIDATKLVYLIDTAVSVRARFPYAPVNVLAFDRHGDTVGRAGSFEPGQRHIVISASLLGPEDYLGAASVVIHESWHAAEAGMEAIDYRRHAAFRRELGELLGVRTFEHVYFPGKGTDPAAQLDAIEALRASTCDYATKNADEGTAELFTAWWLRDLLPATPLVLEFGAALDRWWPADLRTA